MPRALRCVLVAALLVSALVLGAASIHAMTSGSAMGTMTAATHPMTPSDEASAMHHSPPAADPACDGTCGAGDALMTVLCVAGILALVLLLLLLPRPGDLDRVLRMIVARTRSVAASRPRRTPDLSQLSISRT